MFRAATIAASIMAVGGMSLTALADTAYPGSNPVKIVVPFPAGGPADTIARVAADALGRRLNGTFIVENVPGAGEALGTVRVKQAAPDGYTLLLGSIGSFGINPSFKKTMPYDAIADFDAISQLTATPQIMVARANFPASTLQELVALAKKDPGRFTYASYGAGTSTQLTGELLNRTADIKVREVPYRGVAPALQDLMSGFVDMMFTTAVMSYVESGQLKAIALAAPKRSPAVPNLPTFAEAGLEGMEQTVWFGLLAPRGTPADIRLAISKALSAANAADELRPRLTVLGAETDIVASTPEDFQKFVAAEIEKWRGAIVRAGFSLNSQ